MVLKKPVTISKEYAKSIVNTVREPLIVLDHNLRVVTASRSFYDVFKAAPEETVGQLIYDLGNKQWDIPQLRALLEDILPHKASFDDYEVEHDFQGIGRRTMLLNARRIPDPPRKLKVILLTIEDITRRKKQEESYLGLAAIVNTSLDGIIATLIRRWRMLSLPVGTRCSRSESNTTRENIRRQESEDRIKYFLYSIFCILYSTPQIPLNMLRPHQILRLKLSPPDLHLLSFICVIYCY